MVCSAQTRKMAPEGLRLAAISPCFLLLDLSRRKRSRLEHVEECIRSLLTKKCLSTHSPSLFTHSSPCVSVSYCNLVIKEDRRRYSTVMSSCLSSINHLSFHTHQYCRSASSSNTSLLFLGFVRIAVTMILSQRVSRDDTSDVLTDSAFWAIRIGEVYVEITRLHRLTASRVLDIRGAIGFRTEQVEKVSPSAG